MPRGKKKKVLEGWMWHDLYEEQQFGWYQFFPLNTRKHFERAIVKKQFKKVRITIEEI